MKMKHKRERVKRIRRRGETLTEILVAMVLFALILWGIADFTANQTLNAARIRTWDFFMFHTQKWLNEHAGNIPTEEKEVNTERGTIVFKKDGSILTVSQKNNSKQSMSFTIGN